jgi:hypothetical protein
MTCIPDWEYLPLMASSYPKADKYMPPTLLFIIRLPNSKIIVTPEVAQSCFVFPRINFV